MALLAAHVRPNDPVVAEIVSEARDILKRDDRVVEHRGLSEWPERAAEIAAGISRRSSSEGFDYSNPPASWADPQQKVRTHAQVLQDRAATCLDSAVLYAAALESVGLKLTDLAPAWPRAGWGLAREDVRCARRRRPSPI